MYLSRSILCTTSLVFLLGAASAICRAVEPEEPQKTLFLWNSSAEIQGGPPGLDDPLVSDRPDFTEASSTVGRGRVQLEMGYTYFHDSAAGQSNSAHSFPEMLWRVGMFAEWFEFRIAYNHGAQVARVAGLPDDVIRGSQDLYLGIKLGLTPQQGWLPEMALVPQMLVPTGDPEFSSEKTLPGLNWLYGWEINEFLSLAGSTQWNQAVDGTEQYSSFAQSVTIGYTLTEKLGGYTEWFGIMPHDANDILPEYYFNGGFTYSFTNDLQADIRAGAGLNDNAADYFIGSGLVKRW